MQARFVQLWQLWLNCFAFNFPDCSQNLLSNDTIAKFFKVISFHTVVFKVLRPYTSTVVDIVFMAWTKRCFSTGAWHESKLVPVFEFSWRPSSPVPFSYCMGLVVSTAPSRKSKDVSIAGKSNKSTFTASDEILQSFFSNSATRVLFAL